jgi:hypothetical protein
MTDISYAIRPKSEQVIEATQLLRLYPDLEPAETRRLVEVFRTLPILDVALMTTDEFIRPRLDAFRRDHKRELRPPFWHYLVFLSIPSTLVMALTWGLWRAVVGG